MKDNNRTILLVEDEVIIALAQAQAIQQFGYEVITVDSGQKAVELVGKDEAISLILMDIDLVKGIDGAEAARRILIKKNIPIVFLSAHSEREMVERVRGIKHYGYLIKNSGNFVLQSSIEMAFELFEAHEQIRESETRLRTLLHGIPDLVWLKDVDGVFLACNHMFEQLFGSREADIIGKTDYDFVDKELADFFREHDRKAMAAVRPSINEEWLQFASDGHSALFETIKTPMVGNDDRLIGVLSIARDITERRRMEGALNASLQQMHDIIEFLPDPAFVIDKDGKVIYWNKAMERLSGFKKEDMLGQGNYAYALPFYRERRPILIDLVDLSTPELESRYSYVRREENVVYAETYIAHMNHNTGAYLWGVAAPLFDSTGKRIGTIEVIRDITNHRLTEDSLRKSERKYRELADFLPEIVFETDTNLNITYANKIAFTLLEYTIDELAGLNIFNLVVPEDQERCRENYLAILSGAQSTGHEYTMISKSGAPINVVIYSRAIIHDNEVAGIRGIIIDISERKKIENSLRESEEKFRNLFSGSGDAQILMDGDLIIDCNSASLAMMGFADRGQFVGHSLWEFCLELQPDGELSSVKGTHYSKRALKEKSVRFEWQHRRADGSLFYAEVVLTAVPVEGKKMLHATMRDVTERKLLQEQIINIVDIEQKRLGQNLHDGIGQELTGVAFLCNALMKRLKDLDLPESDRSAEITHHIYQIITQVRTLSRELYPPNLVENEIAFTLADFASNIENLFGITCKYEQDTDLMISNIHVSTQLYYIVREAVNNSIRHGKAQNILIRLKSKFDRIILSIEDDGDGLPDIIEHHEGLGLRTMAYRMESIHGDFCIRRNASRGVSVECTLPAYLISVADERA